MEDDEDGKSGEIQEVNTNAPKMQLGIAQKMQPMMETSDFEEEWNDFSSWRHDSQDNLLLLDEDNNLRPQSLVGCRGDFSSQDDDVGYDYDSVGNSSCMDNEMGHGSACSERKSGATTDSEHDPPINSGIVTPESLQIPDYERLERGLMLSPAARENYKKIAKKMRPLPLPEKPCVPMQEVLSARASSSNSAKRSVDWDSGRKSDSSLGMESSGVSSQAQSLDEGNHDAPRSHRGSIATDYGVRTSGFQLIRESSYSILDRRRRQKVNRSTSVDHHLANDFSDLSVKER